MWLDIWILSKGGNICVCLIFALFAIKYQIIEECKIGQLFEEFFH
jgi:hypothetical protein